VAHDVARRRPHRRQRALGRDGRRASICLHGKSTLLGISKRGDKTLRRLDKDASPLADWARSLLLRRHSSVVVCALANKLADMAWALARGPAVYDPGKLRPAPACA